MKRRHTEQPIPLNLPPMILTFSQLRPRTSSSPVFRKEVTDAMKLCPRTQHSRQFSSPQPRGCDQVPLCSAVRFIGPLDGLSSLSGVGSSPMILFLVGVVTDCVSKHRSIMGGLYSIGDWERRQRSNCNDIQLNDGARQNQKLFQKQSMYMRLHTYMHAYIHAYMHTYTHAYRHTFCFKAYPRPLHPKCACRCHAYLRPFNTCVRWCARLCWAISHSSPLLKLFRRNTSSEYQLVTGSWSMCDANAKAA